MEYSPEDAEVAQGNPQEQAQKRTVEESATPDDPAQQSLDVQSLDVTVPQNRERVPATAALVPRYEGPLARGVRLELEKSSDWESSPTTVRESSRTLSQGAK